MVTVEPKKPMLNIVAPNGAEPRSTANKGEFDAIFRQVVDSTVEKGVQTESAQCLSDIRPIQFAVQSLPSAGMIADRIERLIDTMGAYQQKLIDRGATLKDIQPLVDQLTSQSESLSATSDTVEVQERLKTIVNQSLALASMEIAKFNSGGYNDG